MAEYIEREAAIERLEKLFQLQAATARTIIDAIPAADVVEEENILKFYYVRSIDEYWIGQRIDNFYYAEYDPKRRQWVWTHSRHLPWGEHIVSPTSLWKEHTYPSEPEEIPFAEWLQGFIKKHAADVVEVRWLPVVGYEGLYEVSNFGDVRCSDGTPVRQSVNHKKNTDYKCVWLKKNGVGKTVYVHRIVAEAFIPNPNNLPIVNHMDEDGTNNRSDNLEWCTLQYNTTYGTAIERRVAKVRGRKMSEKQKRDISASVKKYQNSGRGFGKRIVCLETGEEFTSIRAAAEHFELNPSTVGMCCLRGTNGRKYTFRYCNKMDGDSNRVDFDTVKDGGVNDGKAD